MQIKSYDEAIRFLENFIGKVRFRIDTEFIKEHDPLERVRVLLSLLGNPQDKFSSVLVGGTSGKGSTAYLISQILTKASYKTGLTLSPHLQKINERIQINGEQISDEKFTGLLVSILDSIEGMKKMDVGAPSYFEILIAMAFLYFAKEKVDIAVVEVGMGGEFDATNTLYPLAAVLTNVSLDHTNVLGGTVQKIARTKVGIIKGFSACHPEFISGSPARRQVCLQPNEMPKQVRHDKGKRPIVITGAKQASVIKIIEDRCKETGSELLRLGKDFDFKIKKESLEGSVFDLTTDSGRLLQLNDLKLPLLGKYQVENASLAIETVRQLADFGFRVSEENIKKALETAFFPGRFEIFSVIGSQLSVVGNKSVGRQSVSLETDEQKTDQPESENRKQKTDNRIRYTLVLDGAHNPTKMKAFLSALKKLYPRQRKIFIIGFKFDKDIPKMLKQILEVADILIITQFKAKTDTSNNASTDALNIKHQILKIKHDGKVVVVEKDSKKALDKALTIEQFSNSTIIVVTGSLYLVGEIRSML